METATFDPMDHLNGSKADIGSVSFEAVAAQIKVWQESLDELQKRQQEKMAELSIIERDMLLTRGAISGAEVLRANGS